MTLYHGTSSDITEFGLPLNHLKWGFGTYFYPKLEMASLFCLKKWWNLESGLKDNAKVYECEVDIQLDRMYKMTPLIASMVQAHVRSKYPDDEPYSHWCDIGMGIKRRGYMGIIIDRALSNEAFGGNDMNILPVNEYKYEQYCILDSNLITIKRTLDPVFWDADSYKFDLT